MKSEKEINKKIDELVEKQCKARDENNHLEYAMLDVKLKMLVWVLEGD